MKRLSFSNIEFDENGNIITKRKRRKSQDNSEKPSGSTVSASDVVSSCSKVNQRLVNHPVSTASFNFVDVGIPSKFIFPMVRQPPAPLCTLPARKPTDAPLLQLAVQVDQHELELHGHGSNYEASRSKMSPKFLGPEQQQRWPTASASSSHDSPSSVRPKPTFKPNILASPFYKSTKSPLHRNFSPLLANVLGPESPFDRKHIQECLSDTKSPILTETTKSDQFVTGWCSVARDMLTDDFQELQVQDALFKGNKNCVIKKRDLSCFSDFFPDSEMFSIPSVELFLSDDGIYQLKILSRTVKAGKVDDRSQLVSLLHDISDDSDLVVCPGLKNFGELTANFEVPPKKMRTWDFPLTRTDSTDCSMYHIPQNRKSKVGSELYNVCNNCKKLKNHLDIIVQKRKKSVEKNEKNSKDTSKFVNYRYLSENKKNANMKKMNKKIKKLQKDLKKAKKLVLTLSDNQSKQLENVTKKIDSEFKDELEEIFEEAESVKSGRSMFLRSVWEQDLKEKRDFFMDQRKNVSGKVSNRWSMVTLRMCLAVYTRSPAAYEALSSFNIMQLPSVSSMKSFTGANYQKEGPNFTLLHAAKQEYQKYNNEREKSGKLSGRGDGVLVIDEVKVVSKVQWNSANNGVVGYAMTSKEMESLDDTFEDLRKPDKMKRTNYVLQTLWRDLTSDFDVIGLYFTSENGMDSKFIIACLFTTIHSFHIYGFETSAVVLDGASTNLKAAKVLTGFGAGAFGFIDDPTVDDPHYVKSHMLNPFTNRKMFFIPCPTHQLKSLIAALHSSRNFPNGKKDFQILGLHFGWKAIQDMWAREMARANNPRSLRRVPDLQYRYVYRDAWTRLNVPPAKVLQQTNNIAELKSYRDGDDTRVIPPDATNVDLVIQFLEACNLMFENDLLCGEEIRTAASPILNNLKDGFNFFRGWADHALEIEPQLTSSHQIAFLAWQTWDLTRLMVYGFTEFADDFFGRYPNYYIWPRRINGSALETIFGQLKFSTGGHLSAVNYPAALASLKMKRQLHGRRGKFLYRNAPLYLRQGKLRRRKRVR